MSIHYDTIVLIVVVDFFLCINFLIQCDDDRQADHAFCKTIMMHRYGMLTIISHFQKEIVTAFY